MRSLYRIFRTLLVTAAVAAVALPALLWVVVWLPPVQRHIRDEACRRLTELTGMRVTVDRLSVRPFSEVTLQGVTLAPDLPGAPAALRARRLGAGVNLWQLASGRFVVTYVELVGADIALTRPEPGAPLNIQPLLDSLKPREPRQEPSDIELAINNIVLRRVNIGYDILSAPEAVNLFGVDPSHLHIANLKADITIPHIGQGGRELDLSVRRLSFEGPGALGVERLRFELGLRPDALTLRGFDLSMPGPTRLLLADLAVDGGLDRLTRDWRTVPFDVELLPGSAVTLPGSGATLWLTLRADGTPESPRLGSLQLAAVPEGMASDGPAMLRLDLAGRARGLGALPSTASLAVEGVRLQGSADMPSLLPLIARYAPRLPLWLGELGAVTVDAAVGSADASTGAASVTAEVTTALGSLALDGSLAGTARRTLSATLDTSPLLLSRLSLLKGAGGVGQAAVEADVRAVIGGDRLSELAVEGTLTQAVVNGTPLSPVTFAVTAAREDADGYRATAALACADPVAAFDLHAAGLVPARRGVPAEATLQGRGLRLVPAALGLTAPADSLSASLDGLTAIARGTGLADLVANVSLTGLALEAAGGRSLALDAVDLALDDTPEGERQLSLESDAASLELTATSLEPRDLQAAAASILNRWQPAYFQLPVPDSGDAAPASLRLRATLEPENPLEPFLRLPVGLLAPVTLDASLSGPDSRLAAQLDAPYLSQGDKLIEHTTLTLDLDGRDDGRTMLHFGTLFPAKGGQVSLRADIDGTRGNEVATLNWTNGSGVNRGNLAWRMAARPSELQPGSYVTAVDIDRGEIVFNDTAWTVDPCRITVGPGDISLTPFALTNGPQAVRIYGAASRQRPDEALFVELDRVNLDYVFHTLNIEVAMFGGTASGRIAARGLLGDDPEVATEYLRVDNLTYNDCLMGDGDLSSTFDFATTAVTIGAVIHQRDGRTSLVDGKITPKGELLDFRFTCDRAPVGFLRPFMAAFCNGIRGYATGQAHLFGTFSDVDMTGDVIAESLEMDIDITGTTYHTGTDRVVMSPGRIDFSDVTLYDAYGNTGQLSGTLTHDYFHRPCFSFRLDRARGLLAYDKQRSADHPWWGRVFANGAVGIDGVPGHVSISANVAAVRGTDFYFELSDQENAAEHSFITFRDRTPAEAREAAPAIPDDPLHRALERLARKNQKEPDKPSDYDMTFSVDVTPQARLVLVMDPVGGDRIIAHGSGNMRLSYDSADDDLRMYGTYTLEQGSYTFTLQDIFIKDFTIDGGSSIAFHGDPYNAQLDIKAHYALTANLTDLDESFANDRDLARTNVPVHAMLLISGDMRTPDIDFDIAFPTLQSDVYRKVRSIVSTDDMMNRQILYLLALNRFYTPEYMTATRGNELVSVASSTISSRLGNMLGQLSDKVSIAPAIRSDRGDFSDVEFDVALSSRLLNNRLLLNGTFGYRDPSLNSSAFIGDFDVEYLLNRSGTIRLRAYNHYNDQNYYLKSALTTQGAGVVFKRDFDRVFSFLDPLLGRWRRPSRAAAADTDTVTPNADPVEKP